MPPGAPGSAFTCITHPTDLTTGNTARGAVLYIHPFAEEMNKSRRMAALQSRALAAAGFAVLQLDLLGCGDSSGDFSNATWDDWVADVVESAGWLRERYPDAPMWLWGLRAGALLACAAAARLEHPVDLLFWQPTPQGKAVLQQFLRLKLAGQLIDGQAKGQMEALRKQLAAGQALEIAGYVLSPALAQGLEAATLAPPPQAGRLEWLELGASDEAELSPAAQMAAARWRDAGWATRQHIAIGPMFWQTTEIEDAPALLAATTQALREPMPPGAAASAEATA